MRWPPASPFLYAEYRRFAAGSRGVRELDNLFVGLGVLVSLLQ